MAEIRLVRDVLDQQLLDREGRKAGKVDGIVLEIAEDGSARVLYLEIGTAVLARRISVRLAEWYERLRRRLVAQPAAPFRVSWKKVRQIDVSVHVDVDTAESDAYRLERWLSENVIGRIPGSHHRKK